MTDSFSTVEAFISKALTVWSKAGVDPRNGDFVEALDLDGTPLLDLPRRGRTQARQILTFAMAHAMGDDPDGHLLDVAQRGYAVLKTRYMHRDGGVFMAVNPDGSVADAHRFAYELAFVLMAQGWLYRATSDKRYAEDAQEVWAWLEANLRDGEHDGFLIGLPDDRNDPRQQNPHMHLFEASLLNTVNIGGEAWRRRMNWLFGLFQTRFYDADERCLREFFQADWQLHEETGDRIDPGHHFEWSWLLGLYAKATGAVPEQLLSLYEYGCRFGLSAQKLGWDEIYPRGGELRFTSRLWVQCEVLKGHLTLWTLTGNRNFLVKADEMLDLIVIRYLVSETGCWKDQLDASGTVISANSPASTLYHLYVAFAEYRLATAAMRFSGTEQRQAEGTNTG